MDKTILLLETGGFCCLCFSPATVSSKISSLQLICQYLKVNMNKIVDQTQTDQISASPVTSSNAELMGNLCENCGRFNKQLKDLYEQLKTIRIELQYRAKSLHGRVEQLQKDKKIGKWKFEMASKPQSERTLIDFGIAEKLQTEIIEKGNSLFNPPRSRKRIPTASAIENGRDSDSLPYQTAQNYAPEAPNSPINILEEELEEAARSQHQRQPSINAAVHADNDHFETVELDDEVEFLDDGDDSDPTYSPSAYPTPSSSRRRSSRQTKKRPSNSNSAMKAKPVTKPQVAKPNHSSLTKLNQSREKLSLSLYPPPKEKPVEETQNSTSSKKDKIDKYTCPVCKYRFTTPASKESHMRIHTGERPFACKVCPKTFRTNGQLTVHTKHHIGTRNHKCHYCDRAFVQRGSRNDHEKVQHWKELGLESKKTIVCSDCGKMFCTKSDLSKHMTIHREERPHKCDLCGNTFRWKSVLMKHYDAHRGSRDYLCRFCGKSFIHRTNCQYHEKTVHKKQYYDLKAGGAGDAPKNDDNVVGEQNGDAPVAAANAEPVEDYLHQLLQ